MQTNLQEKEKNKKQMISLIFLSLSIIIGFFFTLDQAYVYVENKDMSETIKKEVSTKKGELEKLQSMVKSLESNTQLQGDIERFGSAFREDTILNSIFAPTTGINIANISMSKGEKTPNGLSLATITLALKAQDIATLNKYLDYLTNSTTNTRSYIVKSINLPLDTTKSESVSTSLVLNMYYFE